MKKKRINWTNLKSKYFSDQEQGLQAFLEKEKVEYTAYVKQKTFGWYKEKKEYLKDAIKDAKQEIEQEKKEEVKDIVSAMLDWKSKGIRDLITTLETNKKISVRDRIEILKFIKLELWETGEIVENRDNSFKIVLK